MKNKEASARIKINKLLEESGWRFEDSEKGRANIRLEAGVKISDLGDDFEHAKNGYIDYLLLDDKSFPLCVLEAKRESIHPLSAKETQARPYATGQNCRFVILSNGVSHYLWDVESGHPEIITEFPTQSSLLHRAKYKPNTEELISEKVDDKYLEKKNDDFSFYPNAKLEDINKIMTNPNVKEVYFYGHGSSHVFQLGTREYLYYCEFSNGKYEKDFVHQMHCGTEDGKSLVDYVVPEQNKKECFWVKKSITGLYIEKILKKKIRELDKR